MRSKTIVIAVAMLIASLLILVSIDALSHQEYEWCKRYYGEPCY